MAKKSSTKISSSSKPSVEDKSISLKEEDQRSRRFDQGLDSISQSSHYFSIVPLHLIFSIYVIHFLPNLQQPSNDDDRKQEAQVKANRIDSLIKNLVENPYQSLIIINSGLFLVQIWFSKNLRKIRENSLKSSSSVSNSKKDEQDLKNENEGDAKKMLESFKNDLSLEKVLDKDFNKKFLSSNKMHQKVKRSLNKFMILIQESISITILGTLTIHLMMILLGSNVIKDFFKTLLLSNMISIICVLPTSFVVGWNRGREKQNLIRIFSNFQPKTDVENALFYPSVCSLFGCWLGAIPIPLDWDRPWQTWPVTCIFGTSLGHILGTLISILICIFKNFPSSSVKQNIT